MPILDEMKMTDRAAEIEVQQILAQGNNAQQNRVTFHPLRQIFGKFLPAAQLRIKKTRIFVRSAHSEALRTIHDLIPAGSEDIRMVRKFQILQPKRLGR